MQLQPPEEPETITVPALMPPHNRQAEEAVIGCVLARARVYPALADVLAPQDFFIQRLGWVWETFARLTENAQAIDLVTVSADLEQRELLEEVGGQFWLTGLATNAPSGMNVDSYAATIRETAGKRRALSAAGQIAEYSLNGKSVSEIVSYAQREFGSITGAEPGLPIMDSGTLAGATYEAMAPGSGTQPAIIPTGFIDLDRILRGGQRQGRLMLVAGRPGEGKSALLLGIGANAALAGKRVGLFSMEMPNEEQTDRLLSQLSGIPYDRIETRKLHDDDWPTFTQAVARMADMQMYFDDTPSLTIPDLRARCRRMAARGLDLILVDSLNLMDAQMPKAQPHERINWLGYQLKIIAREWKVPVLAAHHMNRTFEQKERDPQLSDLEQAGEKPADIVSFIFQRSEDNGTNTRHLKIAKHRGGPLGILDLQFRAHLTKFENSETRRIDLNA